MPDQDSARVVISDQPARTDLTDRECANILAGVIGALVQMVEDPSVVRRALLWWGQPSMDPVWEAYTKMNKQKPR